jgi:hypothetical protein
VKAAILLALMAGAPVWTQPLSVYSELARIDGSGKVIAPDSPREILSPALVRNGFTSFQVVVQVPAETKWWLFVGQNPENSVKVTLYRERGELPEPVELPYASSGTQVLWMDVWTAGNALVQRIKVEPELKINPEKKNDDWVIYPIEGRVMEARVPDGPAPTTSMHAYLCGAPESGPPLEGPRLRNSEQDVKLLNAHASAKEDVKNLLGGCDAPPPSDPESYLRIRDYLFRLR